MNRILGVLAAVAVVAVTLTACTSSREPATTKADYYAAMATVGVDAAEAERMVHSVCTLNERAAPIFVLRLHEMGDDVEVTLPVVIAVGVPVYCPDKVEIWEHVDLT